MRNKLKHVLVTGGAGYVGAVLIPKLLKAGYGVKVLDLYLFGGDVLNAVKNHPKLIQVKGDIRDTVLLKKEIFERGLEFDHRFRTGGSDRQFFKKAMARGLRFVAIEEAPVYEVVPPERWKKTYYVRRALANGSNSFKYSLNQLNFFTWIAMFVKSTSALLVYTLALPINLMLGSHFVMRSLEKSAHHLSRLFAMVGIELIKKRSF